MLIPKKTTAIILGLLLAIISGCSIGTQAKSPDILSTSSLANKSPLGSEITPQPSATVVESKISYTRTVTISLVLPATQTPTHIRTSSPTSTPDPRLAQGFEYLMKNPFRCDTPCLWGIIPEKTNLDEAQNIARQIGRELIQPAPNYYETGFSFKNGLQGSILLKVIDSTIGGVRFEFGGFSKSNSRSDWSAFTVEQIIKTYGDPAKIDIIISVSHDVPSTKTIFIAYSLYYDNLIVMYSGVALDPANGFYQFCPKQDILRLVNIWYGRQAPNAPSPVGYRLDEIFSMDIVGFSKLITQEPKACINFNLDPPYEKQ